MTRFWLGLQSMHKASVSQKTLFVKWNCALGSRMQRRTCFMLIGNNWFHVITREQNKAWEMQKHRWYVYE